MLKHKYEHIPSPKVEKFAFSKPKEGRRKHSCKVFKAFVSKTSLNMYQK